MLDKNLYNRKWKEKYPWYTHYIHAKGRCIYKKCRNYNRYGGRGIKFLMTKEDFKYLWFRDRAYQMNKPSIDRIDNDKHYELSNCRFIELKENSKRKEEHPKRRSDYGTKRKKYKSERSQEFIDSCKKRKFIWDERGKICGWIR